MTSGLIAIVGGLAFIAFRKPLAKWELEMRRRKPRYWATALPDSETKRAEAIATIVGLGWIAGGLIALFRSGSN